MNNERVIVISQKGIGHTHKCLQHKAVEGIFLCLWVWLLAFPIHALESMSQGETGVAATVLSVSSSTPSVEKKLKLSKKAKRQAEKVRALEQLLADVADREDEGLRCISTSQIRHTDVVNNQAILFYMRHNKILINPLPFRCPGLRASDTFMYETRANKLCDLDSITVLDNIGTAFLRGARCGLGRFYEISEDSVGLLTGKRRNVPRTRIEAE